MKNNPQKQGNSWIRHHLRNALWETLFLPGKGVCFCVGLCYLCGIVHWEILHRRDETLSDQLAVRRRGLSLNKLRLHASHLSLKRPAERGRRSLDPAGWDSAGSRRASAPVLSTPERVEFEGAAERDDQQETADQAADQGGRDHLPGHGGQAVPLVAAVQAVLLAVAAPRLEDAQVSPTVKVPRLAVVAVLLVGPVRTPLLVVAALRGGVAHAGPALAGELSVRARRACLLVAA